MTKECQGQLTAMLLSLKRYSLALDNENVKRLIYFRILRAYCAILIH